jgi:hypothetical protein
LKNFPAFNLQLCHEEKEGGEDRIKSRKRERRIRGATDRLASKRED